LASRKSALKAATALDTLMQVVSDEPVPPSQLQSRTPRDLETICLKCLHKDPAKRYASAAALAEELRRFQNGETITARPAGMVERARKWAKRRPAAAALLVVSVFAGLTVVGVVGTAAALVYGKNRELFEANVQLTDERNRAKTAEEDARTKEAEAVTARDDLEKTLARSLLRPLALQGGDKPMTEPEWEALWELATTRRGRLGYRFVEEASRTPVTSRQLRDRAALALHAAVGLDARRRAEVEARLLARLEDPVLGDEQKTDLALVLSAWEALSNATAVRTARQLTRAMKVSKEPGALEQLARGLSAVAGRLEATDAAQAATTFVQAIKDAKEANALGWLAEGLSAVASRLESKDAAAATAEAANILAQALKDTKDATALRRLARGLSAVASRLESKDAAATLVQALKDTKDPLALRQLAQCLSAVAARMEPKDAATTTAQAAATLLQAMKGTKAPNALQQLAQGLSAVAACLEAKDAAQAAATLAQVMSNTKDSNASQQLAQGLSAVLSGVPPPDIPSRSARTASVVAFPAVTGHPLTALALLLPAAEPPPCRLSTQQLVELLKMPTCVAEARRVILDHLGNRYRRTFADVWEFVRFAQEQKLDLDFTTPPQRPETAAPAG
jgi:hypothetical protein